MTEHTEATLTQAIRRQWGCVDAKQPRYVVAVQVNNGAGFSYGRILDAVVFDTWPSKGLLLHGMEIKVSKPDLRRELQDTRKFAEFAPHLDTFSIVAPKGVASLDLLPGRWGLYCPDDKGGLRTQRKPLMLHDDGHRKEINRSVMAAFCRALVARSMSREGLKEEYDRGLAAGKEIAERETARLRRDHENLSDAVAQFEAASGIKVDTWDDVGRIGEAVKFVRSGGLDSRFSYSADLRDLGNRLLSLADELDVMKDQMRVGHDEMSEALAHHVGVSK